jgi:hypothetical protein
LLKALIIAQSIKVYYFKNIDLNTRWKETCDNYVNHRDDFYSLMLARFKVKHETNHTRMYNLATLSINIQEGRARHLEKNLACQ